MGRHSRKGSAPSTPDTGPPPAPAPATPPPGTGRRRRPPTAPGQETTSTTGYGTPAHGVPAYGTPAHGTPQYGTPAKGTPVYGTPAHGVPQYGAPAKGAPGHGTPAQGAPAQGTPGSRAPRHATPAHGVPQYGAPAKGAQGYGTPAQGSPAQGAPGSRPPRHATPAHGVPQYGTPAHGTPQYEGTPAHGTPAYVGGASRAVGAPARGVPGYGTSVRGGHPQHDEVSGVRPGPVGPRRRVAEVEVGGEQADVQAPFIPGPRREGEPEAEAQGGRGGLGRTLTGVAAAAVATVLAVVVAGQVAGREEKPSAARAAEGAAERPTDDTGTSRSDDRAVVPVEPAPAVTPPTYEQLMTRQFPIDPKLKGSGEFEAVPGLAKAPGKGRLIRYRVDVEKGIGLDGKLFADAVQKTLNDKRSWSGRGEMTFERISSGEPEFVITLASPGTTGEWCKKSGLDTTVDNVSCDSASTERVMINAFRWAQGSVTFGPKAMYAYRQMLINHEVGHRLGHGHVSCRTEGALAPVMQQQTKSLDIDGIKCRPNPWVYPTS
ncbi:DUF3152 domain-containing protein [Streptomyces sp. NPDC018711]|uniref:DUF3152 domain-containing protein n=1 Tax=Streptomyces sp. NPDC018711 TaxID=3365052 RepID=UPI00379B08C8